MPASQPLPASQPHFLLWSRLALHALWLHGLWEAGQCRLFYDMSGVSGASDFGFMIVATGADVFLTIALVAMTLRFRSGAATAILIEIVAHSLGWWRYSPTMPALLFFGRSIGLLPVVQMALLPPLSTSLACRCPFGRR
jgi:hypothetical protein